MAENYIRVKEATVDFHLAIEGFADETYRRRYSQPGRFSRRDADELRKCARYIDECCQEDEHERGKHG